jgi:hypothetical protein
LAFPGAARPWIRDHGRSAPPALSSPAPTRITRPGLPPQGAGGEAGAGARAAMRAGCGAGRVLAGGPALPEGKAGRPGRGVPGGDRRRCPAGRWPMGRAGLPPGTAGIHPRLRPPRQVRPARPGDRPGTRAGATRREGPTAGRAQRGGRGSTCRDSTRHRRASARCRRAAR